MILRHRRLRPCVIRKQSDHVDHENDQYIQYNEADQIIPISKLTNDQYTGHNCFQDGYVFLSTYNMYITIPILVLLFFTVLDIHNALKYNGCIDVNKYFDFSSGIGGASLICLNPFIYLLSPIPKTYIGMPNLYYIYVVFRTGLLLSIVSQIIINIEGAILYNNTRVYECVLTNYADKIIEYNTYMDISIPVKLVFYTLLIVLQFVPLNI